MPAHEAQTVLGPVPADRLGHTQFHEHLLLDMTPSDFVAPAGDEEITLWNYYRMRREHPPANARLIDADVAVTELGLYAAGGGRTIVDATSVGIGRDPEGLRDIASRSGVNVVMGSGYYTHPFHPPGLSERSVGSIADEIVAELTEGVGTTGIRAGIIGEIGLFSPLHPVERTVLRAAAIASRETGAALLVHPGHSEDAPLGALRTIEAEGGSPDRVVLGHIDRTLFDVPSILSLAATGCYVEFDLFGQEMSHYPFTAVRSPVYQPNDATRVDYLLALVEGGYLRRILISQDVYTKTSLRSYGGEGYTHILEHVIPLMRQKGLTAEQIRIITVDNPRDALTGTS